MRLISRSSCLCRRLSPRLCSSYRQQRRDITTGRDRFKYKHLDFSCWTCQSTSCASLAPVVSYEPRITTALTGRTRSTLKFGMKSKGKTLAHVNSIPLLRLRLRREWLCYVTYRPISNLFTRFFVDLPICLLATDRAVTNVFA